MASKSQHLKATVTVGGALSESFKGAMSSSRKQIHRVGDAIGQLKTRQKRLNAVADHWNKWGKDASRYRKELARVNTQIGKLQRSQERIGRLRKSREANLAKRGRLRGQMFGAVALGATVAAPIKAAVDFESTMADLNKVANLTPKRLEAVRKQILGMSREMPMAADQIGAIMTAAAQSGIAKSEMADFTRSAIKMGVAMDLTGDEAGTIMAKWRAGMGLTQEQAVALADATNYLSNNMAATAPEVAGIVKRVGAYAKAAGIGQIQTAALGASLVAAGAAPERAARAIKRMASNLTAGASATNKQKEALKGLGLNAEDMADRMQDDAAGAIELVLQRVKQLDEAKQPAVLKELFGQNAVSVIAPLLTNLDDLHKAFNDVADASTYTGSMQKEYASRVKTTANDLQLLKNKTVAVGISLGTLLLPGVTAVAGGLGSMLDKVATLSERFPFATKLIVGATASLVGLKIAALAGGWAFTFLKGGVINVAEAFERVRSGRLLARFSKGMRTARSGMIAFNVAAYANPVGLVVGAIVAGGLLIYKYWKPLKAFFTGLWDGLKSAAAPVGRAMDKVFSALGPVGTAIKTVGGAIKSAIGWFMGLFAPVDETKEHLQSLHDKGAFVGKAIASIFETMANKVASIIGWIGSKIEWLADKLSWIGNAYKKVKGMASSAGSMASNAASAAGSAVGSAYSSVKGWLGFGGNDDKPSVGSAQAKRPQYTGGSPKASGSATVNDHSTTNNHINIVQQPGEDADALAKRTADEIDKRNRQQRRAALFDGGPAYGY